MPINVKGVKGFLDRTGIGKGIRNVATAAISAVPGVGPVAARVLDKLPHAVPNTSEGQKAMASAAQKTANAGGTEAQIKAAALQAAASAIESDSSDPRNPLSNPDSAPALVRDLTDAQQQAQKDRSGASTPDGQKDRAGSYKGDTPPQEGGHTRPTPPKVTFNSVIDSLIGYLPLVIGIIAVIAAFMRIPMLRQLVMGGARRVGGYARRSYTSYRQRRRRKS